MTHQELMNNLYVEQKQAPNNAEFIRGVATALSIRDDRIAMLKAFIRSPRPLTNFNG